MMSQVLFWVFLSVFVVTCVFAFIALYMVLFDTARVEKHELFVRFAGALWVSVLVEVAVGIFALWRNLFGLNAEADISTVKNQLSELIDGLEADGSISKEKADILRDEYSDKLGRPSVKPVLPKKAGKPSEKADKGDEAVEEEAADEKNDTDVDALNQGKPKGSAENKDV